MQILAVCGLGQGSSLLLKMTIEDALKELGVKAQVDFVDVSAAKGMRADVIVTSPQLAPLLEGHPTARVVTVRNYFDKHEVRAALEPVLKPQGT